MTFAGEEAEALSAHALMERLELGRRRGFGSIRLTARIGGTEWRTSVFPQRQSTEWVLLVSKKVLKAEGLSHGDTVEVSLTL